VNAWWSAQNIDCASQKIISGCRRRQRVERLRSYNAKGKILGAENPARPGGGRQRNCPEQARYLMRYCLPIMKQNYRRSPKRLRDMVFRVYRTLSQPERLLSDMALEPPDARQGPGGGPRPGR
jgi:hypothetical protein